MYGRCQALVLVNDAPVISAGRREFLKDIIFLGGLMILSSFLPSYYDRRGENWLKHVEGGKHE
jgi:hypothetical protein